MRLADEKNVLFWMSDGDDKEWSVTDSDSYLILYKYEVLLKSCAGQQRKITPERQLPVLILQTLLDTFLFSVSPGIETFLQKKMFYNSENHKF